MCRRRSVWWARVCPVVSMGRHVTEAGVTGSPAPGATTSAPAAPRPHAASRPHTQSPRPRHYAVRHACYCRAGYYYWGEGVRSGRGAGSGGRRCCSSSAAWPAVRGRLLKRLPTPGRRDCRSGLKREIEMFGGRMPDLVLSTRTRRPGADKPRYVSLRLFIRTTTMHGN